LEKPTTNIGSTIELILIAGSKHGKAHRKSCQKSIKLKKGSFSQKHKKIYSNFKPFLTLNWVYCKSTTKILKNWNNKSRK